MLTISVVIQLFEYFPFSVSNNGNKKLKQTVAHIIEQVVDDLYVYLFLALRECNDF